MKGETKDSFAADTWFRWMRWTVLRGIAAAVWTGVTIALGLVFTWRAQFTTYLWGEENFSRSAALDQLVAAGFYAAGPLGVWLVRRKLLWLLAALGAFVAAGLVALRYYRRSVGAG